MKLWRKKGAVEKELPSFLNTGLTRINHWLISAANYLQCKTNGYSCKKKKLLLMVFTLVFVLGSAGITIQGFKRSNENFITVTRIKTVRLQEESKIIPEIGRQELLKIERFKNYVDRLSTTVKGRTIKDSLLRNRPHLMDSVDYLINLFSYNKKLQRNEK